MFSHPGVLKTFVGDKSKYLREPPLLASAIRSFDGTRCATNVVESSQQPSEDTQKDAVLAHAEKQFFPDGW